MKNIALFLLLLIPVGFSQAQESLFRIGIIGMDTSHVISFTKYLNDPNNNTGCKVVAGYPGGSLDVAASIGRVDNYTLKLQNEYGVEIVGSIEDLCKKTNGILLESVDGRTHLEQLKPVLQAKKPVFIDKPVAGSLADTVQIFNLAKKAGVPCWSSSSLRFSPDFRNARTKYGQVLGCTIFSPCDLEEHHPDLYWYGVHGIELLFTIMGTGCKSVQRTQTADTDYVVGVWADGRIGSYRGLRSGKKEYGGIVFGANGIGPVGTYTGYAPLIEQIVQFFKTGTVPVTSEETIEIFAFMTAADESKKSNGKAVSIDSVIEKAKSDLKK